MNHLCYKKNDQNVFLADQMVEILPALASGE